MDSADSDGVMFSSELYGGFALGVVDHLPPAQKCSDLAGVGFQIVENHVLKADNKGALQLVQSVKADNLPNENPEGL